MKRAHVLTIAKLAVAVGLIAFVIHQAGGWESIEQALRNIDRVGWVQGLLLVFTANCLAMLRWHLLMRSVGLNSTPWLALRLGFIGVFFNNVVPGLTGGDLVKAVYVTRENPTQRASAVISVAVDRIIGIVALALIAAVVIPLDLARYQEIAVGTYAFLAAAGVGAAVALSRRLKARLRSLLGRGSEGGEGRITGALRKIDQAISMYRDRMRVVSVALVMSVAVHLLIIVALSVFGNAIASGGLDALAGDPASRAATAAERAEEVAALERLADVDLTAYCSIVPIIMIASAVPIAPAGWGVGEYLFARFFRTVSVTESHALALSFTYRITTLLISLLGGLMLVLDRKRVLEVATSEAAGPTTPTA